MYDDDVDYDDPEIEAAWAEERRKEVIEYLETENIAHGGVDFEPYYCVAPHVSIWGVIDSDYDDQIFLWVICGDLPTDCVSVDEAGGVREVLAYFGKAWTEVAACMKAGKAHPEVEMGSPEDWEELAPILESRAEILLDIAGDDSLWEEEESL